MKKNLIMKKRYFSVVFGAALIFGLNINISSAQEIKLSDSFASTTCVFDKENNKKNTGNCVKRGGNNGYRCKRDSKGSADPCSGTFNPIC